MGAWVAQPVKCLVSAQVMISLFMGLNPESGSVLNACSEPGACSHILCLVSLCPSPARPLSHFASQK